MSTKPHAFKWDSQYGADCAECGESMSNRIHRVVRETTPHKRVAAARRHARAARAALMAAKRELNWRTVRESNVLDVLDDAIQIVNVACRAR